MRALTLRPLRKIVLLGPALDAFCVGAEPDTLRFNYRVGYALICEPEISTGIVFGACAIAATKENSFYLASLVRARCLIMDCDTRVGRGSHVLRDRHFSTSSYSTIN